MLTAVANAGDTHLELIQPLNGDMVYVAVIEKYGYGGIQYFGIAVDNMEEALRTVRNAGIAVTIDGTGYGVDGDGYFAYQDTEALVEIILELLERPARRQVPYKVFPESGMWNFYWGHLKTSVFRCL